MQAVLWKDLLAGWIPLPILCKETEASLCSSPSLVDNNPSQKQPVGSKFGGMMGGIWEAFYMNHAGIVCGGWSGRYCFSDIQTQCECTVVPKPKSF